MKEKVLSVRDLTINFKTEKGLLHAVRGVNLDLLKGETLAIVGESGSGKSATAKALLGLSAPNTEAVSGNVLYGGRDILRLPEKEFQKLRGNRIAMIPQDSMSALDPIVKTGKQISETVYLKSTDRISRHSAKQIALRLMAEVGIDNPELRYGQYPFQLSGGLCQRAVIAAALSADPEILICDEPTTALDVTVQAQVLELILKLKEKRDLSVIFITHDLGVVANIADRVAVMYAGKIVEYGTTEEIFENPAHPYTWGLLDSSLSLTGEGIADPIPGSPPDMYTVSKGDAFAPRNPYAMEIDFEAEPPMFKITDTHYAATWLLHPSAPKVDRIKQYERQGEYDR